MTVPADSGPYEAYIESALAKLRGLLGPAEIEGAAVTVTVADALAHTEFALHTTRYLFTGPSIDTMLRNTATRATATRLVNKRGVPVWSVTPADGGIPYEVEESILNPEVDWKCVYNPLDDDD